MIVAQPASKVMCDTYERLGRGAVFPLAEALTILDVPFVFATAYSDWSLPEPYEGLPHCAKPLDQRELLMELAALSRVC